MTTKDKIIEDEHSDLKIEVSKGGYITIIAKSDDVSIFLGKLDGMRCKLIKKAFSYARSLK